MHQNVRLFSFTDPAYRQYLNLVLHSLVLSYVAVYDVKLIAAATP